MYMELSWMDLDGVCVRARVQTSAYVCVRIQYTYMRVRVYVCNYVSVGACICGCVYTVHASKRVRACVCAWTRVCVCRGGGVCA